MNRNTRDQLSIGLMSASLLLLFLFLLFWLNRVYNDQQEALKKETSFLFQNVIRNVEDSIFQKNFLQPLMIEMKDSIKVTSFDTLSNNTTIIIKQESLSHFPKDTVFEMAVKARYSRDLPDDSYGSIAILKSLSEGAFHADTVSIFQQSDSSIIALLSPLMKQAIRTNDIPLDFNIIAVDSANTNKAFSWANYTDHLTHQNLVVEYLRYQPFLLRQIVPHILFSVFLFSCIALAFLLIYRSLRQQQRLTQLKNDFISNISHELKTPITTVGVAIEALSNFDALKSPERTQEYLDISKSELSRLSLLVDKVLKLTLFEQAEPELNFESIDLKSLVQNIQASMKLQVEKFAAHLSLDVIGSGFTIKGDRIHLTSVIYNLIDNALKYSPNKPNIQIGLQDQEEQVIVSVRDKGIGISNEYKDKIFEKFFRIPTGNTHNVKGHGLGLSYVASVIQKHAGRIEVDSQEGQGTCFTIYFPKQHG